MQLKRVRREQASSAGPHRVCGGFDPMNFVRVSPRLLWLASLLAMLLQRAPLLRPLAAVESVLRAPLGHVLRALVPAAAVGSAVHAQTGATQFTTNPGSPVSGRVGQSLTMVFSVTGAGKPAGSYGVDGPLPAGLVVTGPSGQTATVNGTMRTLNAATGILSGVPTQSGTFGITLRAWENANRGGDQVPSIPVILIIAEDQAPPSFSQQPVSTSAAFGANASFSVTVTGSPAPTLQWRKGTTPIAGATGSTLALTDLGLADAGDYSCVATNALGSVTSAAATLTVTPPAPPVVVEPPVAFTALQGSAAFFSAEVAGTALAYQWLEDGVEIPGATFPGLYLADVQPAAAGAYAVRVSNPGGAVTSATAALTVVATGGSRLVNLATRAFVGTGGDILIPGLVINGAGTKNLLVRAVGPRLGDFGVAGVLADPQMAVFRTFPPPNPPPPLQVATNDDWPLAADQPQLEATRAAVGAFPLVPSTKDAATLLTLVPGSYTVQTSGVNAGTGVGLVEIYDADAPGSQARLVNISARAVVGTGADILIPGFVIEGDVGATVLLRAIGPTLAGFNVAGALVDPVMTVRRTVLLPGGATKSVFVAENDDWEQTSNLAAVNAAIAATGAFPIAGGTRDAMLLLALGPGGYTVQVAGKDGGTGVALVELYLVTP